MPPLNNYILPAAGTGFARSATLTSFASTVSGVSGFGYLALATYENENPEGIWTFDQTILSSVASTSGRYIDSTTDGVSGFYILGSTGPLVHIPTIHGTPVSVALATSPSFAYTGLSYNSSDGKPYFVGYDGTIYKYSGGIVSTVHSPPGGVSIPARHLYSDGSNNLWTMFSNSNSIARYFIGGSSWTVVASPFTASLDTISYSTSVNALIAGGTNYTTISDTSNIIDIAYSNNQSQLLVADNFPSVKVFNLTSGGFSLSQTTSNFTGIPTHIAIEPDGLQALVTDLTNNRIEVLTFLAGSWSQTSTVPLTGPTSLTVYTSGITQALICQPSQNKVSILNKSGTAWNVVQTLTVTDPTSIAINSNGITIGAVVSTSTGVTFLTFNGAVWSVGSSIVLNPVPTLTASDMSSTTNPLLYAAGISGGVVTVYIFQNSALVGQYNVTSTLGGFGVNDWQSIVLSSNGAMNVGYYVGGTTNNVQITATTPITSTGEIAWVLSVPDFLPLLLIAGTNNIWSYYNDKAQSFTRTVDSGVAILSGASFTAQYSMAYTFQPLRRSVGSGGGGWTTLDVVDRNKVSSITTDSSGDIFAVTIDNDIYRWSSTGILASGYPFTIIPPPSQEEGIPLGLSKLIFWNGNLYSASSLLGGVIQILI